MTAPTAPLQQHAGHAFRLDSFGWPERVTLPRIDTRPLASETFNITTDASSFFQRASLYLSLSIETTRVAHTRTRAINILYISAEILTMAARGYVQSGREKEGKRYGILRWERGACAVSARIEVVEAMRLYSHVRTALAKFSRRIASISPRARYRDTCHLALSPPSQSLGLCCARTPAERFRRLARPWWTLGQVGDISTVLPPPARAHFIKRAFPKIPYGLT